MAQLRVDNLRSCVRYTGWLALLLMGACAVGVWRSFTGIVDWHADGADFPWLVLTGTGVALVLGALAGTTAQDAHHELTHLAPAEGKLLGFDPDADLLGD